MCYSAMVRQDFSKLEESFGATRVPRQLEDYISLAEGDPKRYPPLSSRIFPGHYAPVVYMKNNRLMASLMRYGAYPPEGMPSRSYTTYNARRDNLTSSFWAEGFMKRHGFVVLDGFFEWVKVQDLLQAGCITIEDIKEEFDQQRNLRKQKIVSAGKKYKPTATEQKDPRARKIIIEFQPDKSDLIVPVIYTAAKVEGRWDAGFAIVTDEPPAEVEAAGHDRRPVILKTDLSKEWLTIDGKNAHAYDQLLSKRREVTFSHRLDRLKA